jgi:tyrosyl-tRNA synthetase
VQRDFAASPAASNSNSQPPQVFGLTLPLLTTADGQKFGKSTGAPIWLAAPPKSPGSGSNIVQQQQQQCSSPYELYQFFLTRTADADLGRFLRLFTDYSLDQIRAWEAEYMHCSSSVPNNPKALARILAEAVTTLVHGAEGLKEAQRATAALFGDSESGGTGGGGGNAEQLSALSFDEFQRVFAGVPSVRLGRSSLESSPPLLTELCVLLGAAKTKAEAKRLLAGGGLYLNGTKLLAPASSSDSNTNAAAATAAASLAARRLDPQTDLLHQGRALILRAGKKKQFVLFVEDGEAPKAGDTPCRA